MRNSHGNTKELKHCERSMLTKTVKNQLSQSLPRQKLLTLGKVKAELNGMSLPPLRCSRQPTLPRSWANPEAMWSDFCAIREKYAPFVSWKTIAPKREVLDTCTRCLIYYPP